MNRWFSKDHANFVYAPSYRPWLDSVQTPNGLPTLDFGPGNVADAPFMVFGRALHAIRSVYMVWRPRNIDTFLLGGGTNIASRSEFLRDFSYGSAVSRPSDNILGTVANGTLTAGRLVCDAQATTWPEVTGAFAVTPGLEIVLQNLDAVRPLKGRTFPVLDVAAVVDADNLDGVVFMGEPVGYKARAMVAEGRLVVSLVSSGTTLILR